MFNWLKQKESGAADLAGFGGLAIGVMLVVIVIALANLILAQFGAVNVASFNNNSDVNSAIDSGITNLATLSNFVAIVVIVAVVSVIISLVGGLGGNRGGLN